MRSDAELLEAARKAALKAYAPYSNFRVGASVLTSEGAMFSSANVENAAYPVSQCAEANAINFAVSQGMTTIPVVAVACIDAASLDGAYPCGRCRQIMSEFGVERILVTTGDGEAREHTLDELLPHRFEL
ncbi:MAG: cytidine deaminase [Acidimicrobiia bacterium]|nr:cytidine deaminase [Acidimicrobiia bacterium]